MPARIAAVLPPTLPIKAVAPTPALWVAEDVLAGLALPHKSLPAKLFYDGAGSALFDAITRLPEYYLTRTELKILEQSAAEIAETAGSEVLIELGAGTAAKTPTLLRALLKRRPEVCYIPVDISPDALEEALARIAHLCPEVLVQPRIADFAAGFEFLPDTPGPRLVVYLGSSIGNFEPENAIALLSELHRNLSPDDSLLLGTDMTMDIPTLLDAYNDAQGVTAEFNKNVLRRINREFRANFDLGAFCHIACWNPKESRIEMHLESMREQSVTYGSPSKIARFAAGERIHTENSYKYSEGMVVRMLADSGFRLERSWYDDRRWFGLHLARC